MLCRNSRKMKIQVALLIVLLQATLLLAQAPASRVVATNTVLKSYVVPKIVDPKAVFVKDAKAHVPIDLGGSSAGQFRVLTSDGNRWNVATNALKYSASSTNIVVPTNRQYIMLENLDKGAIPKAWLSAKFTCVLQNRRRRPRQNRRSLEAPYSSNRHECRCRGGQISKRMRPTWKLDGTWRINAGQ